MYSETSLILPVSLQISVQDSLGSSAASPHLDQGKANQNGNLLVLGCTHEAELDCPAA